MNIGAIVEARQLSVRLAQFVGGDKAGQTTGRAVFRPGRRLGDIEEGFVSTLSPGDTFLFAGEVLRLLGVEDMDALVHRATGAENPAIPSYNGGKFPLSTFLADRVRQMIHDRDQWVTLPDPVREWFEIQRLRSEIPAADELLVETFARGQRHYLVCYPFEGRLAHQTLGMLLTRRLERLGARPLGFVASEYALAVWAMTPLGHLDIADLLHPDLLGDDLEAWLDESVLMKRHFAHCALISGLIARHLPGDRKTARQVTFSTDLIYDVLRSHEPDHILLRAARQDAATGFLDIRRLSDMLMRIRGRLVHRDLLRISPFAVPVMLEVGREPVQGASVEEAILREAESDLIAEAMQV
jgi:ATP-dependent Lhr-like helicase